MFRQRVIVFLTAGPLMVYLIYRGGLFYVIPVTAVLLLATYEYAQIVRKLGWQMPLWLLLPAVFLQLLAGYNPAVDYFAPFLVISLLAAIAYVLWLYEKRLSETAVADWFALMAGILILGWIGSHFLRLIQLGWQWTMLAIVSAWIADTGAYVVGKFMTNRILGRHHLSPRLSPNKTIEGFIGGIIIGTGITLALANPLHIPLWAALLLGLLSSIVSPLGDLAISLLKREAGVKDSGTLFPGHGGALDRIDTLLWSVTMAYYLAAYVNR
ncbi:MAG: phosphatidate cytidylyltransferase [Ardenticatenaceae bacterium]|nr:phosphatidate cytidylyltransferase [Ardenticatenaceae bacterium]